MRNLHTKKKVVLSRETLARIGGAMMSVPRLPTQAGETCVATKCNTACFSEYWAPSCTVYPEP